jgi:phage-related protein (TIGR01555 family)
MKLGRLYGGAVGLIVIKGRDDFEKPIEADEIELGSYKGLRIYDRWSGVYPQTSLTDDVDEPLNWDLPDFYQITTARSKSFKVHHSRIVRFDGPELPNWEKQANMYWGASVVEAMFDELKKRDNTSWNIASLVFRANILEMKNDQLAQMLSGVNSSAATLQRFYSSVSALTQLMSNQGMVITGKEGAMGTHQYSFAGIAEVYQQFMLDICGSTEYPMSRLFGRSSSGLSGTNSGDEHSYYELCGQHQRSDLDPILRKLFPFIAVSVWGKMPKDFHWNWRPVYNPTDTEKIDSAMKIGQAVSLAYNDNIITPKTYLSELQQSSEKTGIWTNITDEMVENAPDVPLAEQQMAQQMEMTEHSTELGVEADEQTAETQSKLEEKKEPAEKKKAKDSEPALEAKNWDFQGLKIDIENLRGSVRHGKFHHTAMTAPYGYIKGTEGTDGDAVDVFVGAVLDAPLAYIVHTKDPSTGLYDEDKVILGVSSALEAKKLFEDNYDKPGFFDSMDKMTVIELKRKLKTLRGEKLQ